MSILPAVPSENGFGENALLMKLVGWIFAKIGVHHEPVLSIIAHMVVVDMLIAVLCLFAFFVASRWLWFRRHKRQIRRMRMKDESERFDRGMGDERDRLIHGKIIKKLRAQAGDGQVLIDWLIDADFSHDGFKLTAKVRRNSGTWEDLPFEPHEDSGSWNELLQYGDAASYLFVVKKTYRVFLGFLPNDEEEIVFDQISFTVRNGRFLKEMKEYARDRKELQQESNEHARLEREFYKIQAQSRQRLDEAPSLDERTARFHKEYKATSTLDEAVRKEKAAVEGDTSLSDELRKARLDQIERIAEGIRLEES